MRKRSYIVFLIFVLVIVGFAYHKTIINLYDGIISLYGSKERIKYYILNKGNSIQDITERLIADKSIPDDLKKPLIHGERRIIVFKYLSDNNEVAGYMSYLTHGKHPLMIFLRGGNGYFGIMRPNNRFSFLDNYNVVGTLLRGNIYGGEDELGGKDIDDVENLIKFFPQLEKLTHIKMQPPFDMMGVSRGSMEMFISLAQSNFVKSKISHAISVSGNIDLHVSIQQRPDMKYLFTSQFKKSHETNFDIWLNKRDPVFNAKNLPKHLNILLIYGTADKRVSLTEQNNFKKSAESVGIVTTLTTVPGANHGLDDHFDELQNIIKKWDPIISVGVH